MRFVREGLAVIVGEERPLCSACCCSCFSVARWGLSWAAEGRDETEGEAKVGEASRLEVALGVTGEEVEVEELEVGPNDSDFGSLILGGRDVFCRILDVGLSLAAEVATAVTAATVAGE